MMFLTKILKPPSYGYFSKNGELYRPTHREVFREFLQQINLFTAFEHWLPFTSWFFSLLLAVPFFIFLIKYFSLKLLFIGLFYSMVGLGTYGTVWFHRYATHRSFKFRNSVWRFLFRNVAIKVVPEEIYVVSHHVHHSISEKPGDPYNVYGGWLYCFLADANHQMISKNLDEKDFKKLSLLLKDTGVYVNSYAQYRKWGSLCHPTYTVMHYVLNWSFWYGIFFLIGGHALATAIFGLSVIWSVGIRTFNYDGHGRGVDKRKVGIDFNTNDISVNQVWPGYVAGEWHNNHHLYPQSARSGYLPYQVDSAWFVIRFLSFIGAVTSFRDCKSEFLETHYLPYKKSLQRIATPVAPTLVGRVGLD